MTGWPTTTAIEHVEEYTPKLYGLVNGINATCAIYPEGDKTLLEKISSEANKHQVP